MNKQTNEMPVRYKNLNGCSNNDFKWERSLDLIFSPGSFIVEIDHTHIDVGLPIDFCGKEHYIVGSLIVTDCGSAGTTQKDRIIGQILMFTNRENCETELYTRTFVAGKWSAWRSLAYTGMYDEISTTDELLATVEALVTTTKTVQENLSDEMNRSEVVEEILRTITEGEDIVEELYFVFDRIYQQKLLSPIIKKGSVIEISGSGTQLNFYEEKDGDAKLIKSGDVAEANYTYVRSLGVAGDFTIKVTEKSKIKELGDKIKMVDSEVKTIGDAIELQPFKDITLYPAGDNLFFHYTKEDYDINDINKYVESEYYVSVEGGKDIFVSGNGYSINAVMYDANYIEFGKKSINKNTSYTLPEKCAFIKWREAINDLNKGYRIMVNYGTEALPYSMFANATTLKLSEEIDIIDSKVNELAQPSAYLLGSETIVLASTSEHCLYMDDAIEGDTSGMKYGLTNTQFVSYGPVVYVNKPAKGTKKGVFLGLSLTSKVRNEVYVKSIGPVSTKETINMLDIGSSYIDIGTITERQCYNYTRDGYTVNVIGTMGAEGKRHEARSGGTWDFLVKPLGRAVILDVSGVENLPTTGYPGTTYQDANGVKWTVRGVMIAGGAGKLVLSSFSVDANYGGEGATGSTDYDTAAANMPSEGDLTKTKNDSTGTSTTEGDDTIHYSAKELVYYNPFWNPETNELDFVYYIDKWEFDNPDIITLTFGSNDLGNFAEASQEQVDEVVEKAVSVVDRIHEQLPACKVLVTCSCYGYKGVAQNNFREVFRIKNIQKYYKTLVSRMGQSTDYKSYVRIVPTMCMIDRENGFSVTENKLHSSYPAVKYATDIVHPNTNGFNQFADAMLGYAYDVLGES